MEILRTIADMKAWSQKARSAGRVVGLVPTMGALHEGHLSLVKRSLAESDQTVVSIFVNPKQFGPGEDLDTYPANWEADRSLLEPLGVDAVFLPTRDMMYPGEFQTVVTVEGLTGHLCGKSRPGFFQGVTTVVLKLFHIVQPHMAYFGEKDRQQLHVIRRMVEDLNLDVKIVGCPIVRDADGLAKSSRNQYLNAEQRETALSLSRALEMARERIAACETDATLLRREIEFVFAPHPDARIDYVSVCDADTFEELEVIHDKALVALAVFVGKARLIDNCLIERVPCKEPC
ncbi:pantoate--beta-alanine ligase [Nitrospina gracilis]|uniref:pantoate--beta-alanine ligase n=1 Tax=Nitrospina gracilis TaxID=35801 RepID=UPI001F005286|nr:pantoate--beta-alanine ligase [Nitrospina gracilis]MCF8721023.1 pantoate--beta-alanine ligase [Nitrospina gracilis Nb-211]